MTPSHLWTVRNGLRFSVPWRSSTGQFCSSPMVG
jgi:hypothetical protein